MAQMDVAAIDGVSLTGIGVAATIWDASDDATADAEFLSRPSVGPVLASSTPDPQRVEIVCRPASGATWTTARLALLRLLDWPAKGGDRVFDVELSGQAVRGIGAITLVGLKFQHSMVTATVELRSAVWRTITPASSNLLGLFNPTFTVDLTGWANGTATSGVTRTYTRDAAIFHDAAGSEKAEVTANSAGASATFARANTAFLPVVVGRTYALTASARTGTANIRPEMYVTWYDAGQGVLSTSAMHQFPTTADTWFRQTTLLAAPASAAFARVFSRGFIIPAGGLGSIWFDDFHFQEAVVTSGQSLSLVNAGQVRAYPTYRISAPAQRASQTATVGWKYRKTVAVFNNEARQEGPEVKFIELGDTTPIVSGGKALASGDDVRVFLHGDELPRSLMCWNSVRTILCVAVTIPAGQSATLEIAYGNPAAGTPKTLADLFLAANEPGRYTPLDLRSESGTATSGGASTLTRTGAAWPVNRWRGCYIMLTGGTGFTAFAKRKILSNTADTITVERAWNANPASGTTYLIWSNGIAIDGGAVTSATGTSIDDSAQVWGPKQWIGATVTIATGTGAGQSREVLDNDGNTLTVSAWTTTPDSTSRYYVERNGVHRYYVDATVKRQSVVAGLPVGDVWIGGWLADQRFSEAGKTLRASDGIANAWDRTLMLRNEDDYTNRASFLADVGGGDFDTFTGLMAQRRVGQSRRLREEGVADGVTITNPHGYVAMYADYQRQNQGGICLATVRCKNDGGGQWQPITESAATQTSLTAVAAAWHDLTAFGTPIHLYFGLLPADGVQIPSTASVNSMAEMRWNSRLELYLDVANWSIGPVSAEEVVYDLNATIKIGALATAPPYDALVFGQAAGDGHRFLLPAGYEIVVQTDPSTQQALIALYNGPTLVRRMAWAAVAVRYLLDQDGLAVPTHPLEMAPLPPGAVTLTVTEDAIGSLLVDLEWTEGYLA